MIDLADLEAKARAATQGEWEAGDGWVFVPPVDGNPFAALRNILRDVAEAQANAAFIEAAQPSVVLELIERIRAAEAKAGEPVAWRNTETNSITSDHSVVAEWLARYGADASAPVDTAALAERVKTLEEALEWYGDMAHKGRDLLSEGADVDARRALYEDGGKRARTALGGSNE